MNIVINNITYYTIKPRIKIDYELIVRHFFIISFFIISHNVQRSIQTQITLYNIGKKSIYMS